MDHRRHRTTIFLFAHPNVFSASALNSSTNTRSTSVDQGFKDPCCDSVSSEQSSGSCRSISRFSRAAATAVSRRNERRNETRRGLSENVDRRREQKAEILKRSFSLDTFTLLPLRRRLNGGFVPIRVPLCPLIAGLSRLSSHTFARKSFLIDR